MIFIDSSPAINLTAALGSLELLADLYGTVIVPHAVFQELEAGTAKDPTAQLLYSPANSYPDISIKA